MKHRQAGQVAALQRWLTGGTLTLVVAAIGLSLAADRPSWGLIVAALVVALHPLAIGIEFAWMARANRQAGAPPSRPHQLLQAWWAEVRAAAVVFCWRQPFASRMWPDHLPDHAAGRRGVLLVHGFVCNRGLWNPWLSRLRALDVPHVAVDLEPVFGPLDGYLDRVQAAARRLEQVTGKPPLVVAHSMGGLVVRRWLCEAGAERVHRVLTLGTPHHGTALARWAVSPNARQMRIDSRWLQALRSREPATLGERFVCFWSHCDNVVFPAATAMLPGADNRHLEATAHVHMVAHDEPWRLLRELLEQP